MCDKIPKIIHYCWFGGAKLPRVAKHCIRSWGKNCSDYKIVEWNESNFDVSQSPLYVREAYDAKKWAFVSDYVRLFVLYRYGGIYMDTDLEILKSIDVFLKHEAFSGFEDDCHIPTAIMGSKVHNKWVKMLLDDYNDRKFIMSDGSYDLTTNVDTITCLTKQNYGIILDNTYQVFEDIAVYPNQYFCPKDFGTQEIKITDNTYAIHHFNASWYDKKKQVEYNLHKHLYPTIGLAFEAFEKCDWKIAYKKALIGLVSNPKYLTNRGLWSVMLKSIWKDKFNKLD